MVLVHTQNLRFFYKEKPTCGFGECPLWMEERTLSISGSRSAFDPKRNWPTAPIRGYTKPIPAVMNIVGIKPFLAAIRA